MTLAIRPMLRDDLPRLATWLADPVVHRWWHEDPGGVEDRYGPSLDGTDPTELWIVADDDRPVAFVQSMRFTDEPGYVADLEPLVGTVDPSAASIDYLIGSPADRGRGLGTAILDLVAGGLLARSDVPYVLVPVHADNRASWRALERAGFTIVARGELEPDNPADSRDHVVLRRSR